MKIAWINSGAHNVYRGRLRLFKNIGDTISYDGGQQTYKFVKQKKLPLLKSFQVIKTNFFNIYYRTRIPKGYVQIIGDIFTNSLVRTSIGEKKILYTEYFLKENENKIKKIIFYITKRLFKNKKIIVPSMQSYKTRKKKDNSVFYLPQLDFREKTNNPTIQKKSIKFLYVGTCDDRKKNIPFLINLIKEIREETKLSINLTLVGPQRDPDFAKKYQNYTKKGWLHFSGKIPHKKLQSIFIGHNVFVLPSIVDPIGAVVLEAMAHELPIIVSKNAGSASYIQNQKNGYVCDTKEDYKSAIIQLSKNKNKRYQMGKLSGKIYQEQHNLNNSKVLEYRTEKVSKFINN